MSDKIRRDKYHYNEKPDRMTVEAVNAMFASQRWRRAKPTEAGYYWRCEKGWTKPAIVEVIDVGTLVIFDGDLSHSLDEYTGFWRGPIDIPYPATGDEA